MMHLLSVAPMTPADLDEIMPLERRCFKDPWSRHMYLSDLTGNSLATYVVLRPPLGLTARNPEKGAVPSLLAYGGFWLLLEEAHIATIASHPSWRGCGLGQCAMLVLLDEAIRRGAVVATLEVRVGNAPARGLYEKLGFEEVGRRRKYYRDGEDALIMTTPPLSSLALSERLSNARADASSRLEVCFTGSNGAQPYPEPATMVRLDLLSEE